MRARRPDRGRGDGPALLDDRRRAAAGSARPGGRAGSRGRRSRAGGRTTSSPSTVLTGITPDNDAYREEFFGPVASVYRVGSEEEAIELANDTPFGLGSYVFTDDEEQAQRVANHLDTGMVFVNGTPPRRRRAAVRRRQALRLRPRARPLRHGRVRQQEADPRPEVGRRRARGSAAVRPTAPRIPAGEPAGRRTAIAASIA